MTRRQRCAPIVTYFQAFVHHRVGFGEFHVNATKGSERAGLEQLGALVVARGASVGYPRRNTP